MQLADSNGVVVKTYKYDAFGAEWNPSSGDANPFRYCGEYWDGETGNYYLRARYYDPSIGRFTQEDPINAGLNWYTYCNNNPVLFIDRTGHYAEALQWVPSLSGALPWLVGGIATGMASIKTAIATSWFVPVAIAATAVAAVAIGVVVYQATVYVAEANQAKTWVDAQVAARTLSTNNLRDNTIYVMVNKSTQQVWYVGMTSDYTGRQQAHFGGSKPRFDSDVYQMVPIATGMTHNEARALEQALITAYTLEALANMINSISPSKWSNFKDEFARAGSLISGAFN
ncbi:MAG: RHS repeat-associated core domain-containing protein [Dehalococcoidia bacterium]|nr:RHS repeat-associated core domain-containing protein [Dehalococcoidia bacterium]